jgi:hypothetical protein
MVSPCPAYLVEQILDFYTLPPPPPPIPSPHYQSWRKGGAVDRVSFIHLHIYSRQTLSLSYHHQADLTLDKFTPLPFTINWILSTRKGIQNVKFYYLLYEKVADF